MSSHKEPKVDKSGWLYKQGEARKSWKKRFMKLCGDKLYYYSSPKVSDAVHAPDVECLQGGRFKRRSLFLRLEKDSALWCFDPGLPARPDAPASCPP